jgi:hypothetical protein
MHTDLRAAQVHVIFELPRHLRARYKTLPRHLAYIKWFNAFRAPNALHGLRPLSRSMRNGGMPNAEVISLGLIVRSCHLIPSFGRKVNHSWRFDVMNKCRAFFYNHWVDMSTFHHLR